MVKHDRRKFRSTAGDCVLTSGGEGKRERRAGGRARVGRIRLPFWFVRRDRRHEDFNVNKLFRPLGAVDIEDRRLVQEE